MNKLVPLKKLLLILSMALYGYIKYSMHEPTKTNLTNLLIDFQRYFNFNIILSIFFICIPTENEAGEYNLLL